MNNNMLKEMFSIADTAVIAGFLSSSVDFSREEVFHPTIDELSSFAKDLSRRLTIYQNYMPFEQTLCIYKSMHSTKTHYLKKKDNSLSFQFKCT